MGKKKKKKMTKPFCFNCVICFFFFIPILFISFVYFEISGLTSYRFTGLNKKFFYFKNCILYIYGKDNLLMFYITGEIIIIESNYLVKIIIKFIIKNLNFIFSYIFILIYLYL